MKAALEERNAPKTTGALVPNDASRSPTRNNASFAEHHVLVNELSRVKAELAQVQDELDRTDTSRLQALEDADRLHKQVGVLTQNISELRTAFAQVKSQAEQYAKTSASVTQLKGILAEREAENAQLKATVAQLQRMSTVGGAALAADAARIRSELAGRSLS